MPEYEKRFQSHFGGNFDHQLDYPAHSWKRLQL